MRPEFDTGVIRLERGSNTRVPELGSRGTGSRTWTGSLTPEDGRSMLLRNARTHRATLKATTPCRPNDVSKDGGSAIFRVNPSKEEFSCQNYTTPIEFIERTLYFRGPGSSVGIATAYGLDGPGIESRWGRDFPHPPRPALRLTQAPVQWVPGLSRG